MMWRRRERAMGVRCFPSSWRPRCSRAGLQPKSAAAVGPPCLDTSLNAGDSVPADVLIAAACNDVCGEVERGFVVDKDADALPRAAAPAPVPFALYKSCRPSR